MADRDLEKRLMSQSSLRDDDTNHSERRLLYNVEKNEAPEEPTAAPLSGLKDADCWPNHQHSPTLPRGSEIFSATQKAVQRARFQGIPFKRYDPSHLVPLHGP